MGLLNKQLSGKVKIENYPPEALNTTFQSRVLRRCASKQKGEEY